MRPLSFSLRWLIRLILVAYFLLAIVVLGLRYVVLPQIDQWRPQIQQQLGQALGVRVNLGPVTASWHGLNPVIRVDGMHLFNDRDQRVLDVPSAVAQLRWTALLYGQLQFTVVQVKGVELNISRDPLGHIWMLGRRIDQADSASATVNAHPLLAWLMMQRSLVLTQAKVRWRDAWRQAPDLYFDDVDIRVANQGGHHRAALRFTAPSELGQSLEATVDFQTGNDSASLTDWRSWTGLARLQLNHLQPRAWSPWVDLPNFIESGHVSSAIWLNVKPGNPVHMTLDTRLDQTSWRVGELGRLSFDKARLFAQGDVQQVRRSLGPLLPDWVGAVPEPARDASLPQAASGDGQPESPQAVPTEPHPTASLRVTGLRVDLPDQFVAPLNFDQVDVDGALARDEQGQLQVRVDAAHVLSPAMDLNFSGHWVNAPGVAGTASFTGRFKRAELAAIAPHLPKTVDADARDWMTKGLLQGTLHNADFVLKGELDAFPFGQQPDKGVFYVGGPFDNAIIDYVPTQPDRPGWPRLQGISGRATLDRVDLRIQADAAQIEPEPGEVIQLDQVIARIANIEHDAVLSLEGQSEAPASAYLALSRNSPLGDLLDGALTRAKAQGQWQVPLRLNVPLYDTDTTTVDGSIRFDGSTVSIDPSIPAMEQVTGVLRFSDTGLDTDDLQAAWLGGETRFKGGIGKDFPGVTLSGHVSADALARYVDLAGMRRLSGTAPYTAVINRLPSRRYAISVSSSLQGLAADFPNPLNKPAARPLPLQANWQPMTGRDAVRLKIKLGDVGVDLVRKNGRHDAWFDVAGVGLGLPPSRLDKGLAVEIQTPEIDLTEWERVVDEFSQPLTPSARAPSPSSSKLPLLPDLVHLRAQASRLGLYGLTLNRADLSAFNAGTGLWRIDIDSTETAGTLNWQETRPGRSARVDGKFARLSLGRAGDVSDAKATQDAADTQSADSSSDLFTQVRIPAVTLDVDELTLYGHKLGRAQVEGVNQNAGRLWQLKRLSIDSPGAVLNGTGSWLLEGPQRGLKLDAQINFSDVGRFLNQVGLKDAVSGGKGNIKGSIEWRNMPWRLDKSDIQGTVDIDLEKGRFSSVNSRSAKVLELLSLQSMQRILSFNLNPQDMFREGYPFDTIEGSIAIRQGLMSTNNYRVTGPVGTISLGGEVSLIDETLDLQAMVVPSFDMSGATVAAGIAINPIVGIGAFLTQWLLKTPLSRAMTLHYAVSGKWSDPKLKEIASKAEPAAAGPATSAP